MNQIVFILSELLNSLQEVKGIRKRHHSINNVEKYSLSKLFSKGKGKQKKNKVPSNPKKILNPIGDIGKGKKVNDTKSKKKCFNCGVADH